jgi:hypothetical protein
LPGRREWEEFELTRFVSAAMAAALLLPLPAAAQTSLSAYQAVREALVAVWDELPLSIANAGFVSAPPLGFGQYTPREGSKFALDEPVSVYAELYGYGVETRADGSYARRLSADLALLDAGGALRANQLDFWNSEEVFAHRPLEMHLSFSATLSAFEPGAYTLRFTLHDLAGGKETSFDLPIQLGEVKGS